jgi:hypothetical protein
MADIGKSSPASLRLRGRGQMPDAKSGRVHILHQLAVPSGVAAENPGNHLLLSLTRRSERCRSGSEISGARFYQRQGAERRSGGVEGCRIRDELTYQDRENMYRAKLLSSGSFGDHRGFPWKVFVLTFPIARSESDGQFAKRTSTPYGQRCVCRSLFGVGVSIL